MNELKVFENTEFCSIRTVEENGKVLFCGSDVAKALGYTNANKAINDHCRAITKCSTPISGKIQEINFIPEGDVYRLITHSKLPSAERFEKWVFDEVLPTIRKHGMYATDELLNNPDLAIQVFTALKEERAKRKELESQNEQQRQQIEEMQPKVSYYDIVLNCKDLMSITEIAKDYGKSGMWLNKKLHELKVQYKQGGKVWLLYQKYANKNYTGTRTQTYSGSDGDVHTAVNTYWTQKGRLFIYDLLKANGILPLVEKN